MDFIDVPDDTLDNQDFEEIGEDNRSLFSSLSIPDTDSSLLGELFGKDILNDVVAVDKVSEILNRISQSGDDSFLDVGIDLEGKSIGSKKL